jgi:hypothetical protein
MKTTQLERDPFARATMMRQTVPIQDRKSCAWCGQQAKYRYRWESDGIMNRAPQWDSLRQFCSVGCCRSFSS